MKAPTAALRFSNATSLLDYGFSNFTYKSFGTQGEAIKSVTVTKGIQSNVNAVYEISPSFLIQKGQEASITYEISLSDSVQAPVSEGQQLGIITYYMSGKKLATVSLIAESSIEKINLLGMCNIVFNSWFNLLKS